MLRDPPRVAKVAQHWKRVRRRIRLAQSQLFQHFAARCLVDIALDAPGEETATHGKAYFAGFAPLKVVPGLFNSSTTAGNFAIWPLFEPDVVVAGQYEPQSVGVETVFSAVVLSRGCS